jgi:hypothetical protein
MIPFIGMGQSSNAQERQELEKEIREAEKNGNTEKVKELREYKAMEEAQTQKAGAENEEEKLSREEELQQEIRYAWKKGDAEEAKELKRRMKEMGYSVPEKPVEFEGSSEEEVSDKEEGANKSLSRREEIERELERARKDGDDEEVKELERRMRELEQRSEKGSEKQGGKEEGTLPPNGTEAKQQSKRNRASSDADESDADAPVNGGGEAPDPSKGNVDEGDSKEDVGPNQKK